MEVHINEEQLNEYLDGLVDQQQARQIDNHLVNCQTCARRLEVLKLLFTGLAGLPDEPLQRDLAPNVVAAIRAGRSPGWRDWVIPGMQLAAAAAIVAVAWSWFKTQVWLPDLALPVLPDLFPALKSGLLDAWWMIQNAIRSLSLPDWLSGIIPNWQPWQAGLLLASAGLLCLVGNTILLTSPKTKRRKS